MLGIRISLREIVCVTPLKADGDDICIFIAGTAGQATRIVKVLPEEPVDAVNYWRMTAGRRVSPEITAFQRVVQESVVVLLRFGLLARNLGTYSDAMMSASEVTDEAVQLIADHGDKTLALLQYAEMTRSLPEVQDDGTSNHELLGIWNIQFTVSGNEWDDSLFPLPEFQNTRTKTGRVVTFNYEFLHDQAEYLVVLVMESYPVQVG